MAERIGRYELIKHLATGGMAELYLARATGPEGFNKVIALKRILPQLADQSDFVTMFLDEARLAATLEHQHIAQIHDFGRDGGTYYYTMEYLRGCDLRTVIGRLQSDHAAIDLSATLAIGIAAATGLHYAHEHRDFSGRHLGLVHRDVSPSNIMITYDGSVKLLDFGVAKAAGKRSITVVGSIKGKVAYMSPEQVSAAPVDRRSDIYSLGVVLYELSTGRRLFQATNELDLITRIQRGDVPDPRMVVTSYPDALATILSRAMAIDPSQRYQTALELAFALEELATRERHATSSRSLAGWLRTVVGSPEPLVVDPTEPESAVTESTAVTLPASPKAAGAATKTATPPVRVERKRGAHRLIGIAIGMLAVAAVATAIVIAQREPEVAPTVASPPTAAPQPMVSEPPSETIPPVVEEIPAPVAVKPTRPARATRTSPKKTSPKKVERDPLPPKQDVWTRDSPILPELGR